MPQKPHIADYESLTRSTKPQLPEAKGGENLLWVGRIRPDTIPAATESEPSLLLKASPPASSKKVNNEEGLRRGPAVSFAGLLLFTVVVYFRPYELFSWLSWASSMAFVIAVITLVVYVPTQTGLEGTLTAHPRAIN